MYIAFKWLVSLSFIMWLLVCFIDCFTKIPLRLKNTGVTNKSINSLYKNFSRKNDYKFGSPRSDLSYNDRSPYQPYNLYLSIFIAGLLCVSLFNKKVYIIFARRKITSVLVKNTLQKFEKTALTLKVAMFKYLQHFVEYTKMASFYVVKMYKANRPSQQNKINLVLLNKLKEMGVEKKNLGQLLIAAIQENKNIRMRFQLETLTKNRLMQHIDNIQKDIKQHRVKYISFQQLYLATHQENIFLKAQLRNLKRDKNEAEVNLMSLINEVYRTNNRELKVYCTRFIVKTKDNLLNSDVNAEITEFLERNGAPALVKSNYTNLPVTQRWMNRASVTEVFNEENSLYPVDAPKLKGLPGEYVWTVKDKNGIIEKLYEYESSIDSGDTIKRIRQYSVYYDKDCLLDLSKMDSDSEVDLLTCSRPVNLGHPTNPRFVSSSEAFQRFLQSNNSIVLTKTNSAMLCP